MLKKYLKASPKSKQREGRLGVKQNLGGYPLCMCHQKESPWSTVRQLLNTSIKLLSSIFILVPFFSPINNPLSAWLGKALINKSDTRRQQKPEGNPFQWPSSYWPGLHQQQLAKHFVRSIWFRSGRCSRHVGVSVPKGRKKAVNFGPLQLLLERIKRYKNALGCTDKTRCK